MWGELEGSSSHLQRLVALLADAGAEGVCELTEEAGGGPEWTRLLAAGRGRSVCAAVSLKW